MMEVINTDMETTTLSALNQTLQLYGEEEIATGTGQNSDLERVSKTSSLIVILFFSLAGNGVILGIIMKNVQMRTVINAFVCSLSTSDLLVTIFCMPVVFYSSVIQYWPFGQTACFVHHYIGSVSAVCTTINMAYIAVDRYLAVIRQSKWKIGNKLAALLIASAWVVALLVSIPWDVSTERYTRALSTNSGDRRASCRNFLPSPIQTEVYRYILSIIIGHIIPLTCMLYCFVIISNRVYSVHVKVRPCVVPLSHMLFQSEMRTATTVIIMISVYVLCWFPYVVLMILSCIRTLQLSQIWFDIATWLTWANKAINPTIYALRNKAVSRYTSGCGQCCRRRRSKRSQRYIWNMQRDRISSITSDNRLTPYSSAIFFARSSVDSGVALTSIPHFSVDNERAM